MREHGAFRTARRARRVDDGSDVVRRPRHGGFQSARGAHPFREGAGAARIQCLDRNGRLDLRRRVADQQRGLCVRQEILHLGRCVRGVEGHVNSADLEAAEIEGERLRRLLRLGNDAIPRLDLEVRQHSRSQRNLGLDVPVAPVVPIRELQADGIPVGAKPPLEQRMDVVVHSDSGAPSRRLRGGP